LIAKLDLLAAIMPHGIGPPQAAPPLPAR